MTVVAASLAGMVAGHYGSLELGVGAVILTFFLSGLIQIGFGLIRLGQYVRYIPYPVLSGFMSGIGVIIIALQLFPMIGLSSPGTLTAVLTSFPSALPEANSSALLLAGITIAIIYTMPAITKAIPGSLAALILGTLVAYLAHLDVPIFVQCPQGLPELKLSNLAHLSYLRSGFSDRPCSHTGRFLGSHRHPFNFRCC
jgi:SulP family sulfate permease